MPAKGIFEKENQATEGKTRKSLDPERRKKRHQIKHSEKKSRKL